MRAIRFDRTGGPEVLRIVEVEKPIPGPGEIRIEVRALGLNRADALFRAGRYIEQPSFPSGLGLEAAGVVDALGEGVRDLAVGDVVSVAPSWSMARWPSYAEYAVFPAQLAIRHPSTLRFDAAAATWMQYITAYGALVELAGIRAGDFVAITAASSSVGIAAIQISNRVGAHPIAITRTSSKREALRAAGAAYVVATAEEDLSSRLAQITGEAGVRVALDAVAGPAVEALTEAMSPGGMLIEYGGLSHEPTPLPLMNVLAKRLTVRGYLMHEVVKDDARLERAKRFILEGLSSGQLQPLIARTFTFDQIVEAHAYLESNAQFGKVVVVL